MIRVYPSRLEGEPLEIHYTEQRQTLLNWLQTNVKSFDGTELISIYINKKRIEFSDWGLTYFSPDDDVVDIYPEAKGAELLAAAAIAAVAAFIAIRSLMRRPKTPGRGRDMGSGGISANEVRFGEPMPEIAGSPITFPDYILPSYSRYINKREQWHYSLLCLGVGEYETNPNNIWLGDTRLASLSSEHVEFEFYQPNQTIKSAHSEWWHSVKEAGFTTFGGSGITLKGAKDDNDGGEWENAVLSGNTMQGSGKPSSFKTGNRFYAELSATMNTGQNWLNSDALDVLGVSVGDTLCLVGAGWDFEDGVSVAAIKEVVTNQDEIDAAESFPEIPPIGGSASRIVFANTLEFPVVLSGGIFQMELWRADGVSYQLDFQNYYFPDIASLIETVEQIIMFGKTGLSLDVSVENGKLVFTERAPFLGGVMTVAMTPDLKAVFGEPAYEEGDAGTIFPRPEVPEPIYQKRYILSGGGIPEGQQRVSFGLDDCTYDILSHTSNSIQFKPTGKTGLVGTFDSDVQVEEAYTIPAAEGDWAGPFAATPEGELCDAIEVDVFLPSGMIRHRSRDGKKRWTSAGVEIQWREVGAGNWNSIKKEYGDKTYDQLGFTERIDIPNKRVEVRLRGFHTGRKGSSAGPSKNNKISNTRQWTALRARMLDAPKKYDKVTTLFVKIRSGDKISGATENRIKVRATRKLPTIANENVLAPTRDIMPFFLYLMKSIGYGRDKINMQEVQRLNNLLQSRGDTFDLVINQESTAKTITNHCLNAGFCELIVDRGIITPIRDELPTDPISRVYTPYDYTKPLVEVTTLPHPDEIDGVEVEYVDYQTGKPDKLTYLLPTDEGLRIESITAIGVTDRVKAGRIAARHRRKQFYGRTTFRGGTALQAFTSHYLDVVGLQDGVPEYGQAARVVGRSGNVITLSEKPKDLGSNVVIIRNADGTLGQQGSITSIDGYNITVSGLAGTPHGTLVILAGMVTDMHEAQITSITPGDYTAEFEATVIDPEIYADDNRTSFD